jgi:hypothetical protein
VTSMSDGDAVQQALDDSGPCVTCPVKGTVICIIRPRLESKAKKGTVICIIRSRTKSI